MRRALATTRGSQVEAVRTSEAARAGGIMRGFAWLVGVLGVSANLTHCSLNIYREDLDLSDIL